MGSVITNEDGTWIKGFCRFLGISSNDYAELMAMKIGLELAWSLGIRKLICESCNIVRIKELLARDWEVTMNHTFRGGNMYGDGLAKIGAKANEILLY